MVRLRLLLGAACLCCLFSSGIGGPAIDDYSNDQYGDSYSDDQYADYDEGDDDQPETENTQKFEIETIPTTVNVAEGSTIRLQCDVKHELDEAGQVKNGLISSKITVMWYKDSETNMLTLDTRVTNSDRRITVDKTETGSTLRIGGATMADKGDYICKIGTIELPEIKHKVVIGSPPNIVMEKAKETITVSKGDDVTLNCEASGKPTPTVQWKRLRKTLPDGKESMAASTLTFSGVSRKHEGTYVCLASNGFGQDATARIKVLVEYEPEIEVEELFIHSQTGDQAELVCNVHAEPTPTVVWRKDGVDVTSETKNNVRISNTGHRHSLTINAVKKEDFGEYSCMATNSLGTMEKTIEISGKAAPARFSSSASGQQETTFNLQWSSMSYTDISEFSVQFREEGGEWKTLEQAPTEHDGAYHYSGKKYLEDLSPATRYEARVRAHNGEGWNSYSRGFHFATRGAEPFVKPPPKVPEPVPGEPTAENSTGAASLSSLTTLLLMTCLALTLRK